MASGQLLIQGSRLTLYSDELTTDADQTVNVGERARVRTCFGGVEDACGTVLPGDPRVAGLTVRAELLGPEVPEGLPLETQPGGTFVLPGFQQEGDYRLENIRLVETATGRVLGPAEPSLAFIRVREIVLTSATVRTLSLAELQARGIELGSDNFQAFSFAVGFAFGSEIVEIELPLIFNGFDALQALEEPEVSLDGLPSDVQEEVKRWQPPHIIPFVLEQDPEEVPELKEEEQVGLDFPLFGAIVLPGNVSYLNQFFEARLIVANGAPAGTAVELADLGGSIRLPGDNSLRVAATEPSVAAGQQVPLTGANGSRRLDPGEQASAAWTVEGLKAGTHTLQMDITGQIERPGRDPLPVLSRTQAAVEVVDARFNLTFSHPDVVREAEPYTLFVTVTNLSRVAQNLINVELEEQFLTGAHKADSTDDLRRSIETLDPGQSETVEYRLVADLDGKVVATTFQSSSTATGTIRLRTGVGELGIPLSPATLVLPRFSEQLAPPHAPVGDLLRANVRFLGLAYSLAVAPAAYVPPGLPSVITTDVERRAVDLGQAGHRSWLGEPLLETLEVLALDQLGNRHPLAEMDELRRRLSKGLAASEELALLLRHEQSQRGLGAVALLDHFAETASYTAPWMAAVVVPDGSAPAPELELRRPTELGLGVLSGPAGGGTELRTLPFGEVYAVRESAGGSATVPLAVVGHVDPAQIFEVVLRNPGTATAAGRLVLVLPDDAAPFGGEPRDFRRVDFGRVEVPPGGAVATLAGGAVADPGQGGFDTYHLDSGLAAASSPSARRVDRPAFRLVGARQDFRINERGPDLLGNMLRPNRHGNGVVYLFNRPPDAAAAVTGPSYRIRSTFSGLDTAGEPAAGVSEKEGTAAWVQDDPRVVAVRYSTPLSALVDPSTGGPLVQHEHLLDTAALTDVWGQSLSSLVPPPVIDVDPLHVGGLVDGRVLRGTGEPAEGTRVEMIRIWDRETQTGVKPVLEKLGEVVTGADGRFYFDYVESPHWDRQVREQFLLRATVPEGDDPDLEPADVEEVGSRIRLQNRLAHLNIALLGRGVVEGRLVYADDGSPVTGGTVTGTSTLFNDMKTVQVESDGSFRLGGVPVGPVTLTGKDLDGRRVYATVGIEEPGSQVDVLLEIPRLPPPGFGDVEGRVERLSTGDPIPGATVRAYVNGAGVAGATSDELGRFLFTDLPAGQVSIQAAAFDVSRSAAFTDLTLVAGETARVTLRLADGASRTVTGQVLFHDPVTNTNLPVEGAVAFIPGPGVFAYTDASGRYTIEGVPVQGTTDSAYQVRAIDYTRKLEGYVTLPPVLDSTADVVQAQAIVLEDMKGSVDGVVLDPLGRPAPGVDVVLYPGKTTTSGPDGGFHFPDVPIGDHQVLAHVGDGLQAGRVGWFGESRVSVVYGGHRPFTTVRMGGSGTVTLKTRTSSATGVLTPIYYKPTWYHEGSRSINLKGEHIETSTDPDGNLTLTLPVGDYSIVAYNPFHGIQTVKGTLDYQGRTRHHDIVFEDAATVAGQVVDVDGHTPVPDIEVTLSAKGLLPQKQTTDAQGNFRFELVPKGRVTVTAAGLVGTVERVGRTYGSVDLGGQTLDLTVRMKAQGTVRGQVLEQFNGELSPLAFAQFYVRENAWPYRRIPADGSWLATDADGRYQVSHVYAGGVTVVARDSGQVSRSGSTRGTLTADWQVLDMPDVVMSTSVGYLSAVVRDPASGGPVADAQVRLSNGEWTVSGPDGTVHFDSLALGTYSLYAFHAPTGRSGRLSGLHLASAGQEISATVYLDQRGEVRGTLYDDDSLLVPVPGGTVRLTGNTAGGRVTALATTSSTGGEEGRFTFLGIPEGSFQLEAAIPTSPRRARASATLTETSPVADVIMVLEPVSDVYVRLFEKLSGGVSAADTVTNLFSVRFRQPSSGVLNSYDYTRSTPGVDGDGGSDRYHFPDMLLDRAGTLTAAEVSGEQRSASAYFADFASPPLAGDGSFGDPYQLVLRPKGAVRVSVFDGSGAAVSGADVTLNASGTRFPSVTGGDGTVTFTGVPSGSLTASASSPTTGTGGTARSSLTYDDEVVEMAVTLAPAVAAHGVVYLPVTDDRLDAAAGLEPAPGVIVQLSDKNGDTQLVLTDAAGGYRFDVLPAGSYSLTARSENGDQLASMAGTLSGPDGYDNPLPDLVLDASPPRVISISPPPGLQGVSRTAPVEVVFSEPLDPSRVPTGHGTFYYFRLISANGNNATGTWTSSVDADGFQVVRFTPSSPYENLTTYSLTIIGGSNGVRDRAGRPLTTSGNVGSDFTTSDGIGPEVVATEPPLADPVDPAGSVRFDFNESVEGPAEAFDGDGVADAVELYGLRSSSDSTGEWVRLPVAIFLTRGGYSLEMDPLDGVTLSDDTGQRRVVVQGLADVYGNPMPVYEATYRVYDSTAPVVDAVPYPDTAPEGKLTQGVDYLLVPQLSAIGATTAEPGGDVARVDYYFSDPTDLTNPVSPSFSALEHPFAYPFIGAYSGDGVTPKPFPVWVRAVDTSTNLSNVVLVEMEVLPNSTPAVGTATLQATAPVAGTFYAGSDLTATVSGLDDADGSQLTLSAELRADGRAEALFDSPDRLVERPAEGWSALPPEVFGYTLPLDVEESTPLYVRVTAIDSQGAVGELESERHPVADDATPAALSGLATYLSDGRAENLFFIGESFYVEFRAADAETAVESVEVELDRTDLFPDPLTVAPVAGDEGLYRSDPVAVPGGVLTDRQPVVATVRAFDHGGNVAESTLGFEVAPAADPTAPVATWVTPRHTAPWPADHTSPVSIDGTALLLQAEATDKVEDANGDLLPGTLVSVRFRGPVRDAVSGDLVIDPTWRDGELVPGTDAPGQGTYRLLWRVPNGVSVATDLPFEVRVEDAGGQVTVERLSLTTVPARKVYEGVTTAVAPSDEMVAAAGDPAGAVFLLDGTTLSVRPQGDGTVRSLPAVHLHTGATLDGAGAVVARASILTAPEITTYDSAILYQPLELAVTEALTVGWGSRIDMTAKGLLGNTPTRSMVLPGETRAQTWAGGSHGGLGGHGHPSGGDSEPGTVYDSLREPRLPGGGGTSSHEGPGGAGGGVIRLLAEGALVRLDGPVLADGASGDGGGGAGGAVRIVADRLEGAGRVSARGGSGSDSSWTGGGGGGRISVSYAELGAGVDLAAQLDAAGGDNDDSTPPPTERGGAGTVYVEALDPATGEPAAPGSLVVANPTGLVPAVTPLPALGDGALASLDAALAEAVLDVSRVRGDLTGDSVVLTAGDGTALGVFPITSQERFADATAAEGFRVRLVLDASEEELAAADLELAADGPVLFHGRGRLAEVSVAGEARLVADDDLVLGPDTAPALNDRSFLTVTAPARALLRGEGPAVTVTGEPAAGAELLVGSELAVSWQASDPLGLETATTAWSLDTGADEVPLGGAPLSAEAGPTTLTVPADAVAGEVAYTVTATDLAGRSASATATWTVLPNEAPTAALALAAGSTTPAPAGYVVQVVVDAADREGLAGVTLTASGPVDPASASQVVEVTGTAASLTFDVLVDAAADGSTPVGLQAMVEDVSGAVTASAPLSVAVEANAQPTATLAVADGALTNLRPGESTTLTVQASDPDGVSTVELQVSGPATSPGETRTVSGTDVAETFTVTAAADATLGSFINATAVVTDALGSSLTTGSVDLEVVGDSQPPEVVIGLDPVGGVYDAGTTVTVTATATDDVDVSSIEVTVDGVTTTAAGGSVSYVWTTPPVVESTVFPVTASATDPTGNTGDAQVDVTVDPLADDVPPEVAFTCPTSGAVLPTGYEVTLAAMATDDQGIAWVEYYVEGEEAPFHRAVPTGAPLTYDASATYLLPEGVATTTFRAEVVDSGGNVSTTQTTVDTVSTVDLLADGEGVNDWAALTNETVVLRSGTLTVDQPLSLGGLILLDGGKMTHPSTPGPGSEKALELEVAGSTYIACGGSLDASSSGYHALQTYSSHGLPGHSSGGSHMGVGGIVSGPAAETFGSVYYPQENGGGNNDYGRGGGVLHVVSDRLQVDGAVRADGQSSHGGGAGGSVWLQVETLAGGGDITARGGSSDGCCDGDGGGGAVSIEYGALADGSTVLDQLSTRGSAAYRASGTGTVYLYGPESIFGDLILDNSGVGGTTRLPSLGSGVAQVGSAGMILATDRPSAVPQYFIGHWVTIFDASGTYKGVARIVTIQGDGLTVELDADLAVAAGDLWQGIYRFDNLEMSGAAKLQSDDPVHVEGILELSDSVVVDELTAASVVVSGGTVTARTIRADSVRVASGASLRAIITPTGQIPIPLTVEAGEVIVEPGGAIDATSGGYYANVTYPGHGLPGHSSGGSHLGVGGVVSGPAAETFGSVYFPQESGGGNNDYGRGGGVVRVVADRLQVDGVVRADGGSSNGGGAGGSVWLEVGTLAGSGAVSARGGSSDGCCDGDGGGGAISVEYTTLESGSTLLDALSVQGANAYRASGAGTVYLFGPASTYGDLLVDNVGITGTTKLPALGAGAAQAESAGDVLVTDRERPVYDYFVGHWLEVYDSGGSFKGQARIASIAADGLTVTLDRDLAVQEGDSWQGVYLFDNVDLGGGVTLVSDDPVRSERSELVGPVTADSIEADNLVVAAGSVSARLVRADTLRVASGASLRAIITPTGQVPIPLTIEAGEVIVEPGGAIDATSGGYYANVTYPGHGLPGHSSGGSHMGVGGVVSGPAAETFGSVYFPQESGGGNNDYGRGGGVVRVVADRLQVDGVVRADGGSSNGGGAGGSVWLEVGTLAGSGAVSARGGSSDGCCDGDGGGGAVSIEYTALEAGSTILDQLSTRGWAAYAASGAGTVYLRGPAAIYGDLIVDNEGVSAPTVLPSLGDGLAQPGSSGAVLVTDRARPVYDYFVGHWVEVYDSAGGFKGESRIASLDADGMTVTLQADLGITEGDSWFGVYRFDGVESYNGGSVASDDLIRVDGEMVLNANFTSRALVATSVVIESGSVYTEEVHADTLRVLSGANLTHPNAVGGIPSSLSIDVGEVIVEAGGAISARPRGYPALTTYPGHVAAGSRSGGSHMGVGGLYHSPTGETFGSVYFPREAGGGDGSNGPGGGVIHLVADRLQVDGRVDANGTTSYNDYGSAGGSLWIEAGTLAGTGTLEARGGHPGSCCGGAGGGGAVSVSYQVLEAGTTLLDNPLVDGGDYERDGGAGTFYVLHADSVYGDLVVDNFGSPGTTELPSLGSGVAQAGSGTAVLVTDRTKPVPNYFVGHWIEIHAADGSLKGTVRLDGVEADGLTVRLSPSLNVVAGDTWQGVYRFDDVEIGAGVTLVSDDPIRIAGEAVLNTNTTAKTISAPSVVIASGPVYAEEVYADTLRVISGANLTHPNAVDGVPSSLSIDAGEVVVEAGATISARSRGYPALTTYPGHVAPGSRSGGSHMGVGGLYHGPVGETYGSVYFPREAGSGDGSNGPGGGVIHLVADRLQVDGRVDANGTTSYNDYGSAGGSLWVEVGTLAGTGTLEARGGHPGSCCGGAGGGGAVSVSYQVLEAGTTLLDNPLVDGGDYERDGGAGTYFVLHPTSLHGDLFIDNEGSPGTTELPAFGSGVALIGTTGATLVTDRVEAIPPYFIGHWVRVETPDRVVKGTWRVGAVDGTTATLVPNGTESISLAEGDEWFGEYRFDMVTVTGGATLQSLDPILEVGGSTSASVTHGNLEAPTWSTGAVSVSTGEVGGSYRVTVAPGALADADGVAELRLGRPGHWLRAAWSETAGATFHWPGEPGDDLRLVALDAHGVVRETALVRVALPDGGWGDFAADEPTRLATEILRAAGDEAVVLPTAGELLPTADGTVQVEASVLFAAEPVALVSVITDGETTLRLAVPTEDGLWETSAVILPADAPRTLVAFEDSLHLVPDAAEDGAAVFSWGAYTARQAWAGDPRRQALPGAWSEATPWPAAEGLVLASDDGLRLVLHGAGGWRETAAVATGAAPWSVSVAGDRLFAALPGAVHAWDVSDPSAPREIGRLVGSAYRRVIPLPEGAAVRLDSPGFGAPAVVVPLSDFRLLDTDSRAPGFVPAASVMQ